MPAKNTTRCLVLSAEDKAECENIVRNGTGLVKKRASILLLAGGGKSPAEIAKQTGALQQTADRVIASYCHGGIEEALSPEKMPKRYSPSEADGIRDIWREPPPAGRKKWSGKLVAKEAVERGIVDYLADHTALRFRPPEVERRQNPARKYAIELSEADIHLCEVVRDNSDIPGVQRRANILLLANGGITISEISGKTGSSYSAIVNTKKRYVEHGIAEALSPYTDHGGTPRIDNQTRAAIRDLYQQPPPIGHFRWTLRLLAKEVISRGILRSISLITIRRIIKEEKEP